MGAWDVGNFDNNEALAWVREFLDDPGCDLLRDTLDRVVAPDEVEDLEGRACWLALAAAEMVAALLGKPHRSLPPELADWALAHLESDRPDARLIDKALRTLDRVQVRSDLKDLWDDPEDDAAWRSVLDNLRGRLAP